MSTRKENPIQTAYWKRAISIIINKNARFLNGRNYQVRGNSLQWNMGKRILLSCITNVKPWKVMTCVYLRSKPEINKAVCKYLEFNQGIIKSRISTKNVDIVFHVNAKDANMWLIYNEGSDSETTWNKCIEFQAKTVGELYDCVFVDLWDEIVEICDSPNRVNEYLKTTKKETCDSANSNSPSENEELRAKAELHSEDNPNKHSSSVIVTERNKYVSDYAKTRAKGFCQLCGKPAPFKDPEGKPFLETHHIQWLSKGGADSIDNTVALCPNCHRRMHILNDPKDIKKLQRRIQ